MKKLFFINCAILIFALSVLGQTSKSDLQQLQKELGLTSSISENDDYFPDLKPIKIYLAIKHNKDTSKDFIKWVSKWNKTNGNQYGQLQIVDNIADADIAAVQYQFGMGRYVREESVKMKIGKLPAENENPDKIVLGSIGNSKVKAERSIRVLQIPLYTYLIARNQNSWFVNYARVDERISDENPFPERLLQSAIAGRLKNR